MRIEQSFAAQDWYSVLRAETELFKFSGLPPYLIDRPVFKEFIRKLTGITKLPSRSTVVRAIAEDYVSARTRIAEIVFGSNSKVAVAFDNWDDKHLGEYCGFVFRTYSNTQKMVSGLAFMAPIHRGTCSLLLFIVRPGSPIFPDPTPPLLSLQMERHQ